MMKVSTEDLQTLIKSNNHYSILQYLRNHKLREPELVVQHTLALLDENTLQPLKTYILFSFLSETDHLAILEQLCEAYCDLRNPTLAQKCIQTIQSNPVVPDDSTRLKRLQGLVYECQFDYSKAMDLYNEMLSKNPSNSYALKRKYCILKSQMNKEVEARDALNNYLEMNEGDTTAWMELYHSCMDTCEYKSAAYCLEECILASPLDASLHCLLAETYSSISATSLEQIKLARKHYAQSLELCPNYPRALFGLVHATSLYLEILEDLKSTKKGQREIDEDDEAVVKALLKYGVEKIIPMYKENTALDNVVRKVMQEHLP